MPSEFWLNKMNTYFGRLDIDGDGRVTARDFEALAERFTTVCGFSDREAGQLQEALQRFWSEYWQGADRDSNDEVSLQEFIDSMTSALADPATRDGMAGPLRMFFRAIDADNGGDISPVEFTTFYECMGIDTDYAEDIFAAIDVDGDEVISEEEFIQSGKEFFLSEDESLPSRFFWGPLIIPAG